MKAAEVVIIGGGAIGCCIAYRLAQAGVQVCVLERETPGSGASSSAGGILGPQHEARGPGPMLDLLMASLGLYPGFSEELRTDGEVDIEFRQAGALRLVLDGEDEMDAQKCLGWQRAAKLKVEYLTPDAVAAEEPSVSRETRGAIYFPGEAQVGNRKMMQALVCACTKLGVEFHSGEEVIQFRARGQRIEHAQTTGNAYTGNMFVLASGPWTKALGQGLGVSLPVFPVRGQMIQLQVTVPLFRRLVFHRQTYLVSKPVGRIILGSTMEHVGFDRRVTAEGIQGLLASAARISPRLSDAEVAQTWACFRPGTSDGLPLLGPVPPFENLIAATGHFRNGILLTPITGKLIAELITAGKTSVSLEPFRPGRFQV